MYPGSVLLKLVVRIQQQLLLVEWIRVGLEGGVRCHLEGLDFPLAPEDQVGEVLEGGVRYHPEGLDFQVALEDQVGNALEVGVQYHLEGLDFLVVLVLQVLVSWIYS